jgi:hypothetical protein
LPAPATASRLAVHRDASLNARPQLLGDDCELREPVLDVLLGGPQPVHALPGARRTDPLSAVPHESSDVPLVPEHGADCRVPPSATCCLDVVAIVGRADAIGVELLGDLLHRPAASVLLEHAPHDRSLDWFDARDLARVLRVRRVGLGLGAVAVDAAAGPEPSERAALEAAVRLGLHELQERVVDERERAEREPCAGAVRRHARGAVDDPDVGRSEVLEHDAPGVSEVAREPRQVIDQDRSERREPAAACCCEHTLHVRALEVGAALGRVLVLGRHLEAAARGERPAAPDLVVDRPRILPVRGVARVDRDGDPFVGHELPPLFRPGSGPSRVRTRGSLPSTWSSAATSAIRSTKNSSTRARRARHARGGTAPCRSAGRAGEEPRSRIEGQRRWSPAEAPSRVRARQAFSMRGRLDVGGRRSRAAWTALVSCRSARAVPVPFAPRRAHRASV